MSLTSGFFDSLNRDRRYNAIQMSSIFDGIIKDGVFMSITDKLMVDAETEMTIVVKPGRAWFNNTWTLNDAKYPIIVEQAELILDRIDAVVLEVNKLTNVRANSLKIVKGTPSSEPARPTLTKNADINQYPLAYIFVGHGVNSILQENITNMVGTSECPFVSGILDTVNIDELLVQWQNQWENWIAQMESDNKEWQQNAQKEFDDWFADVQSQLEGDVAGNLLNLINENKQRGVFTAEHSLSDTVHALTVNLDGVTAKILTILFVATADYTEGDTFTFNGSPYTAKPNGEDLVLPDKAFITGDIVSIVVDTFNKKMAFKLGGGGDKYSTLPPPITMLTAEGDNQQITVSFAGVESEYEQYLGDIAYIVVLKEGGIPEGPADGTAVRFDKDGVEV